MSGIITLKQYDGQSVTPKDDAIFYDLIIGKSGIISGCELANLGAGQIKISAGRGIIKGRQFEVLEHTINVTLAETDTLSGRIYIHMDLSNSAAPIRIMHETAAVISELVQDEDCNETAGVYEIELGTYTASVLTISDLTKTAAVISGPGSGEELEVLKQRVEELLAIANVTYDEETDYLRVLKDGVFVDTMRMGVLKAYLFVEGNNVGEFAFSGVTTAADGLTVGDNLVAKVDATGLGQVQRKLQSGKAISVTNFKKLYVSYSSACVSGVYNNLYDYTDLMLIDSKTDTSVASKRLTSAATNSGTVEIDVSNISGECYVLFNMIVNAKEYRLTISEAYFE